ncbi:hypothetical protein GE061_020347 [Apolygus lucorum]|uniref:G-protein coupled receptors family 2 profile 2 domain-containing protein n=1 Tax=Apolygus lucorum TaxID=248454 RepID=A0A6A4IX48_APOLU|nr:hypothetical protein GE061_020347 [Apolygus lucorum]
MVANSWVLCLAAFAYLKAVLADTPTLHSCCDVGAGGVQMLNYYECSSNASSLGPSFSFWPNREVKYQPIKCSEFFFRDRRFIDIDDDGILHERVESLENHCLQGRLPDELYNMDQYCLDYDLETNITGAQICIDQEQNEKDKVVAAVLPQKIFTVISTVLLLVTFAVYWTRGSVRWSNAAYVINMSAALAVAYGFLVALQFYPELDSCAGCLVMGYSLQYFFLASFFWMNAHSLDLYISTCRFIPRCGSSIHDETRRKKFIRASLYSWGVPFLISLTTFVFQKFDLLSDPQFSPDIGRHACFFISWKVKWIYFYGPITVLLLVNSVLFLITFYTLLQHHKLVSLVRQANRTRLEKEIWFVLQYLKLFFVTGLSWAGEMIGYSIKQSDSYSSLSYVWKTADTFNSLQGIFMFIIFVYDQKYMKKYYSCSDSQSGSTTQTTKQSVDRRLFGKKVKNTESGNQTTSSGSSQTRVTFIRTTTVNFNKPEDEVFVANSANAVT